MGKASFEFKDIYKLVFGILCLHGFAEHDEKVNSISYIESQQEHHQRMNFDNEMRRIFEKLGLEYHPDELT